MQIYQNSRRNFLNSMILLSAGATLKPTFQKLPVETNGDLENKWKYFWQKSGGEKLNTFFDLEGRTGLAYTKGHLYKKGQSISFPRENIIAQPMWIFWKTNLSSPADVVITLFESNSLEKISTLNRYELDALHKMSKDYYNDPLLTAYCNNLKPLGSSVSLLVNKISVKKNSHIQQISYYKNQLLVSDKKFIYNS